MLHVYKDVYPPVIAGVAKHIEALRRFMPGVRSDVIACSQSRRTVRRRTALGDETLVGEWGRLLSTPIAPGFTRELRRLAPDLVHLHMPFPPGELAVATAMRDVPMVASLHADIDRQAWLLPLYRHLRDHCFAKARHIIASSPNVVARSPALERWRGKVTVIPYGVDTARLDPAAVAPDRIAAVRAQFGTPLTVAVGRLVYYKGFEHLIEAAPRLPGSVVIVGDGPLMPKLRGLAARTPRVHLVGAVSDERVVEILAAADCFVLPSVSHAESFGIATLEAQAMGLPAVVTDVGTGTTDAIEPDRTGLVVRPGSAQAIAAACSRLLVDQSLRADMGAAARTRVVERFSAAKMAGRVRDIYLRAIG